MNWLGNPHHDKWLDTHARDLLAFGTKVGDAGPGAAWLDGQGNPDASQPVNTWITCRMAHIYSIGALMGIPGSAPIAQSMLDALRVGPLRDTDAGGWFPGIGPDGNTLPGKSCYDHAFVLLAASSAVHADLDGAEELLTDAIAIYEDKFWDEEAGLAVDTWNTAFTELDTYRGINANMHSVEAMQAVAALRDPDLWLTRAESISRFVVTIAGKHDWRIPEHYGPDWAPELELNADDPAHQFKPYGATVGHGLEWARLLLHMEATPGRGDRPWLVEGAVELFKRAVTDGWSVDGKPGFVYTTDWDGKPVVADRLHWVVPEATNAAAALYARLGDDSYAELYRIWWDYAATYMIDAEHGSWHHQLDADNVLNESVWPGKPDLYHTFQATLIPRLPLYPALTAAVAEGLLP